MRPAYRALLVPLIPCPRAATCSSLDLVIVLDTLKVSESICMVPNTLNFLHGSAVGRRGGGEPHRAAESATGAGQRPHK